jgi:hypothetical protein
MTADMGLRPPLVRGRAFYLERLMIPPGATLHVNVVAQMDGPSTMPVLGQGDGPIYRVRHTSSRSSWTRARSTRSILPRPSP